jgi:hypothetical protein
MQFRMTTDTASIAVFDPELLAHRVADVPDWFAYPDEISAEIASGRLLFAYIGVDGTYDVSAEIQGEDAGHSAECQLLLSCKSGRLFIGPGEALGILEYFDSAPLGGEFIEAPAGTYRAAIEMPTYFQLRVTLSPVWDVLRIVNEHADVFRLRPPGEPL